MQDNATVLRDPRANNLDSLRLLLAALVVLEHFSNLFHVALGEPNETRFFLVNLSDVAVSSFFVISGMLTYVSFQRDPDYWRFYLRRFFRIFPAYWGVLVLQIVAFCALAAALVDWGQLPFYIISNALAANFLSPSFLEGIPAINGSLWTIKIEASYYLLLPLLFPALVRSRWLVFLSVLSFIWAVSIDHDALAKQLPGKFYLFAIGVALARVVPQTRDGHSTIALLLLPVLIVVKFASEDVVFLNELVIAVIGVCFVIAFSRPWFRREPWDISYTLYLVHYPTLVLVTRVLLPGESYAIAFIVGIVLSLALAMMLSLLVERPALRFGRCLVSRADKKSSGGAPRPTAGVTHRS